MGNIKKIRESNGENLKLTLTFFVKLFWELHHKIHGYKKLYLYQKPKQIQPSLDLQIQVENFSSASSCFPPSLKKIQVSSVCVCLMLSDIFLNNNTIRVGVGPTSFLDFGKIFRVITCFCYVLMISLDYKKVIFSHFFQMCSKLFQINF